LNSYVTTTTTSKIYNKKNKNMSSTTNTNTNNQTNNKRIKEDTNTVKVAIDVDQVNELFMCSICGGYLYDAQLLVDCLHRFCSPCLRKQEKLNDNVCPHVDSATGIKCGKSFAPSRDVKKDRVLQSIIEKLMPELTQKEQEAETNFNKRHTMQNAPSSLTYFVMPLDVNDTKTKKLDRPKLTTPLKLSTLQLKAYLAPKLECKTSEIVLTIANQVLNDELNIGQIKQWFMETNSSKSGDLIIFYKIVKGM
jgi:hypothetical protein